ncbi:hypothetical protein L3Q82_001239 [Scortum barcoo]|uniref:Uncharacterized protein n=1 Tax=Scortum barcoo TaxID=214431 RepID=A0ACB8W7K2_9TELE|nr:hypothetical protein L3Q82_001239 [Scortum barcoo]
MSFLRRVAGRSLRDRVRSSVIREELGVEPLLLRIERSQLRWLGHLFRMPPGRLPREVFQACPTGRRPRGRPRTRWRDYVSRLAWERLGDPPGRAGGSVWDLEKAYDHVPRGTLWGALREYGVDRPLLRAIQSLYCRSMSLVRIASSKLDSFPVGVGICQPWSLSSDHLSSPTMLRLEILFINIMNRISRHRMVGEGVRFDDLRIPSLLFADDVVLLAFIE